jgi:hypothetical protein
MSGAGGNGSAVLDDPALVEVRALYRVGDLVLFVGAGVSAAAGLPSWGGLVGQLVARAKARGVAVDEIERLVAKERFVDALAAAEGAVGGPELVAVVKEALVRDVPEIGVPCPRGDPAAAACAGSAKTVFTMAS